MRIDLVADNPLEALVLRLGLAPVPVAHALFAQPLARATSAAQRLGVYARLAAEPADAATLAAELDLQPEGTRLLCDVLVAAGQLERKDDRYALAPRARKWLDPASDTYMGTYIEDTANYWAWWERLEDIVRTGEHVEIHAADPADPIWRTYIRGQFELARNSAPEVAKKLKLGQPRRLLDVAGAHGWFSVALCREHEGLEATVVDLPPSAAVGREIVAEAGMSDRVKHVEGDAFEIGLGGPYDAALCFNLIHHLSPEDNVRLFRRIHDALAPGGVFAVLDLFASDAGKPPDGSGAALGLFFYVTSGAETYSPKQLAGWLEEAGFSAPKRIAIRRNPSQTLYRATRR
jgi:SAM-dependent methyltransferase